MKYLSNYVTDGQTKLFQSTGAFFAFSDEQFNKSKIDGVKYASLGIGMICPTATVKELLAGLESTRTAGIAADIAENGILAIIRRELSNHEAQISCDIEDTVDALDGYGITRTMIQDGYGSFFQECVDNDWF